MPDFVQTPVCRSAGLAMLHTNELKEGIALVEKGLVHGPGNADLLDVLEQVRACVHVAAWSLCQY